MTRFWNRALLVGLIGAAVFALTSPLEAVYQPEAESPGTPESRQPKPRYVQGQLIVKYKDSVTECVHCLLKSHKPFKAATTDASDSLDKLHAKYRVRAAKAVFRTEAEEGRLTGRKLADLKQHHADKVITV